MEPLKLDAALDGRPCSRQTWRRQKQELFSCSQDVAEHGTDCASPVMLPGVRKLLFPSYWDSCKRQQGRVQKQAKC